jgi:hypothetical protein
MDRYREPQTALNIALHGGFYTAIIKVHYRGPQIDLIIALHGGLYIAIIWTVMDSPNCPYYKLA